MVILLSPRPKKHVLLILYTLREVAWAACVGKTHFTSLNKSNFIVSDGTPRTKVCLCEDDRCRQTHERPTGLTQGRVLCTVSGDTCSLSARGCYL